MVRVKVRGRISAHGCAHRGVGRLLDAQAADERAVRREAGAGGDLGRCRVKVRVRVARVSSGVGKQQGGVRVSRGNGAVRTWPRLVMRHGPRAHASPPRFRFDARQAPLPCIPLQPSPRPHSRSVRRVRLTMIRSAFGSFSGISKTLPEGPVSLTSSPGLVSHRKFEQIPFLAGSSAFSSGHQ